MLINRGNGDGQPRGETIAELGMGIDDVHGVAQNQLTGEPRVGRDPGSGRKRMHPGKTGRISGQSPIAEVAAGINGRLISKAAGARLGASLTAAVDLRFGVSWKVRRSAIG